MNTSKLFQFLSFSLESREMGHPLMYIVYLNLENSSLEEEKHVADGETLIDAILAVVSSAVGKIWKHEVTLLKHQYNHGAAYVELQINGQVYSYRKHHKDFVRAFTEAFLCIFNRVNTHV